MSEKKLVSHEETDFYSYEDDYFEEYNKELEQLYSGKLNQETLELKSTNFTSPKICDYASGSVSDNYIRSHATDLAENNLKILSNGMIRQEYAEQHNDLIDEPRKTPNVCTEIETDSAENVVSGSLIPFEVKVKAALLGKKIVRCCGSSVFIYNDQFGYYEEQTEASLHIAIRESLTPEMDMKLNKNRIAEVVHRIISSPELQVNFCDFDTHTHLINFRDYVYDIKKEMSYDHSPDFLFTSYIDANYRGESTSIHVRPKGNHENYFIKFLKDCTNGDTLKMKSLQQITGYIISNEWRAKKFFVLIGPPHTGKSVWLSLWRSLIGSKYTTGMSLKQLSSTRFMTAELFKSKLNISAEMDENGTIKSTDIIKTITGGDLLTAERKGKDPFQFYGKTKLVAAGNHMPPISKLDGTSAFTDRILFLIFNNTIPEDQRDKELLEKLKKEENYIVDWALEGLRELMNNNLIFTESTEAFAFKLRYINELNNVTEFVKDRCKVELENEDYKVHRKHLYSVYKQYCIDNGVKSLSRQEFFSEIIKLNVKSGKMRINGSTPLEGFRGIQLLSSEELKKG